MSSYMIRDIPPEIISAARDQARAEGVSLAAMMLTLLRRGLNPAAAMGSIKSEARAAASRENGRLGGRPRRVD